MGSTRMPILDMNWLLWKLLISGIGTVLFLYGKRQTSLPHMVAGILFCVYPYFIANTLLMILIAVCLGAALWFVVRLGW